MHNAVVVLQQALHAVDLVAHLLPLRLGLLVVEMLLHQGMVLKHKHDTRTTQAQHKSDDTSTQEKHDTGTQEKQTGVR